MDSGTPSPQASEPPHLPTGPGQSPDPCHRPPPQGGKVLELGQVFIKTVRHFWPQFNSWLEALPDTRYWPLVEYDRRFLTWWGLLLFCFKLGSRRQLDFQLRDLETGMLENVNRLAQTDQDSLPVNKTLSHFLGHVGSAALADLRTRCLRQLIRNKVLDSARLEGRFVVAIDGTGYLRFAQRHCPRCLVHKNATSPYYLHPVLEAKLVDPSGLALSMGTEFIENSTALSSGKEPDPTTLTEYQTVKQDCELKAFDRLAQSLKEQFPQLALCLSGDALFACGRTVTACEHYCWSYVLTFKPGRTPALWADFQGLLALSPENSLRCTLPDGTQQHFRWVNDLSFQDDQNRSHTVHGLQCQETTQGQTHTFAWITDLRLSSHSVAAVAAQGGRIRFKIENQGFNIQKNSGLNLEHAYDTHPEILKAYYYLLQIAHLFLQMFERGSLLRHLAKQYASSPLHLFGSLKNLAQRLLDCFRYFRLGPEAFDPLLAARCQIRLGADTS